MKFDYIELEKIQAILCQHGHATRTLALLFTCKKTLSSNSFTQDLPYWSVSYCSIPISNHINTKSDIQFHTILTLCMPHHLVPYHVSTL